MRKHLLSMALVAALGLPSLAQASFVDVSAFGGYTTLAMGDVNALLDTSAAPGVTITKFGGGYYVGADAAFTMFPFLKIGPRVELIAGSAKTVGTVTLTQDATLVPLMLGISSDWSLPIVGFTVKAGVYGGYGLGAMKAALSDGSGSAAGSGNGFVGEVAAQARYSILPTISFGLDLGYRLANIPSMTTNSGDGAMAGSVGKKFQDGAGKDIAVDFSGVNVGASLGFNF